MNERATAMPACIGIIMDGNRRWAKAKGMPKFEGHLAGTKTLKDIAKAASSRGIQHLIVYAFSTENWKREPEEVSYLMRLFIDVVKREMSDMAKEGMRIRFAGQRERFPLELREAMEMVEKESEKNTAITLWVCLSYGGRAEIVAAANAAAAIGEITEESLARHLWTNDMPEPDIIIRTGGEQRLSNFLPWQSVYSELFFTDTYWPDFSQDELDSILRAYAERERRRGK